MIGLDAAIENFRHACFRGGADAERGIGSSNYYVEAEAALRTAIRRAVEPEGWVLVPREPTQAMTLVGDDAIVDAITPQAIINYDYSNTPAIQCWRAMIAVSVRALLAAGGDDAG